MVPRRNRNFQRNLNRDVEDVADGEPQNDINNEPIEEEVVDDNNDNDNEPMLEEVVDDDIRDDNGEPIIEDVANGEPNEEDVASAPTTAKSTHMTSNIFLKKT